MNREGRGVVVKGKFRVLKRTNTMHASTNFQHSKSLMSRSGSSHSIASDPEDCSEGNEAISRRGRRSAIIDNLNIIGESSNSQSNNNPLKTDQTSNEPESKINNIIDTNVQTTIPSVNIIKEQQKKILKKQNTIADLTAKTSSVSSSTLSDDGRRKSAKSFLKLIDKKSKSKESMLDLQEALKTIKPSEFHDSLLMSYYDLHWTDLIPHSNKLETETLVPDMECRRRDAVWELFKSELVFLVDHLLVLKHCFMEPLKALQVEGHLMFIEPQDLYGNLDELCYVSYNFCRDFITALTKEATVLEFGTTDFLLRAFTKWSQHSKDGEVFHNYCINYECALTLLDILQKYEPFLEFERWCEMDPRCHRLQLSDLLVAPMQHYTKMPLLLSCIRKYTIPISEKQQLTTSLHKFENSLRNLEDKMRWLKNFERLQEIQSQLIWLPISEMEPRIFIPEFLKHSLSNQPCERLIANPKRTLMHEGYLFLNDGGKTVEVYGFLFDDFFLIAKIKKTPKKKSVSESNIQTRSPTDGALFIVYRQPIALDRFTIHDVGYVEANANGLRNAFVLVIMTRFQQIIGVYTLQSTTDIMKNTWIEKLRIGQQQFQEKLKFKLQSDGYSQQTNKHSKLLNQIKSIQNCKESSIYLNVESNPSSSPLSSRHGSLSTLITNASDMQLKIPCDMLYDNLSLNSNPTSVPTTPEKLPSRPDDIQYTSLTPGSFSPPLSPTIHDFEIDVMGNLKPENYECLHLDLRRISQELFKDGIPEEDCYILDSIDRNIPSTTTDLNPEMIE